MFFLLRVRENSPCLFLFHSFAHCEGPSPGLSRKGHGARRDSVPLVRFVAELAAAGFHAAGGYRLDIHFAPTDEPRYVTQSAFLLTEVATMLGYSTHRRGVNVGLHDSPR